MKITKELLDNEIAVTERRLEQAKASANQLAGAVSVLKNMRDYLAREPEARQDISPENKAAQDRDEALQAAMTLPELAEAVAGPGAVADEPERIEE